MRAGITNARNNGIIDTSTLPFLKNLGSLIFQRKEDVFKDYPHFGLVFYDYLSSHRMLLQRDYSSIPFTIENNIDQILENVP